MGDSFARMSRYSYCKSTLLSYVMLTDEIKFTTSGPQIVFVLNICVGSFVDTSVDS